MVLLFDFIDRQFIHFPPVQTASFKGKTAIVTGASSGLGLEACRSLINLGAAQVILTCRNLEKGVAAAKNIQASTGSGDDVLKVWFLNLSDYESVKAFARKVEGELERVDILIANAGIGTRTFRLTQGTEETITTNLISLSLLGFLLLPTLRRTAAEFNTQTHFSVTGSELYEFAAFKELAAPKGRLFAWLSDEKKTNMGDRYNVSKLMVLCVVRVLAAMMPLPAKGKGVIVNCVAPGFCQSGLGREVTDNSAIARGLIKILARPTAVGARTLIYGACAGPETHGQYLPDCKITRPKGLLKGEAGVEVQKRVWSELKVVLEGIQRGVTEL